MIQKQHHNIYIASCEKDGGIYQYRLMGDGTCEAVSFTRADRPMYMTMANGRLYVLLLAPFKNEESGLVVYDVAEDGSLKNPSDILSTRGTEACHLMVDGETVYCVNYTSGSVIKMPDCLRVHEGRGINPDRQEKAHTHYVGMTPDHKYVCVTDLGLDTIFLYDRDLKLCQKARVPEGHGVRHLVFSENGRYLFAANELESTVSVFAYTDGQLDLIDTKSCLPEGFKGKNTSAAIRLHDGRIYVSNRGHDSVAEMTFDGKELKFIRTISCNGKSPRDFMFVDRFMICTNQGSNTVTILKEEDDGNFILKSELVVGAPLCVIDSLL